MATDTAQQNGQLLELAAWVQQYAATRQQLEDTLKAQAQAAWVAFDAWYDTKAVASLAADMANLAMHAEDLTVGAAQQYVGTVTSIMRGTAVQVPPITVPPLRNGADPLRVHTRPAEVYRLAIARGEDEDTAVQRAVLRAEQLAETDVQLAGRGAQKQQMEALGVQEYRRVLHPELAKHGSCGLCVVASDRIYHTGQLMPIHDRCNCEPLPIVDGNDPGKSLNAEDLQNLYAAAGGSTAGKDLKRVRVTVHEHGELGPVLRVAGENFRGPADVPLEKDPARARRMLEQLRPVLTRLEERQHAGEDVTGPLTYQRDLIDRLSRIVDDVAA